MPKIQHLTTSVYAFSSDCRKFYRLARIVPVKFIPRLLKELLFEPEILRERFDASWENETLFDGNPHWRS